MFDVLIKGGTIVDGSGGKPPYTADVAVQDGRIVAIGKLGAAATARQVIDADGAIVTPGFVDLHTHYDGQFVYDDVLDPSFSHGVTTAIGGNCGVGFAPARPEHRRELVELMEGVEDIPGIVLDAGLDWKWSSFGDYLDRLDSRSYTMDVACQIAHAPVRVFVMKERALAHEKATAEDVAAMASLVGEAMADGAIGFSGARCLEHFSTKGAYVPGTFAEDDELLGIAKALGEAGHGVFQTIPLGASGDVMFEAVGQEARKAEHDRILRIAEVSRRPVLYTLLQSANDPADWQMMMAETRRGVEAGLDVVPMVGMRGIGATTLLDGNHIFMGRPSYRAIAHLPLAERAAAMREPDRRAAILAEGTDPAFMQAEPRLAMTAEGLAAGIAGWFPVTPPIDYEPDESRTIARLAAAAGVSMEEYLYDHYCAGDGTNICLGFSLNYDNGMDTLYELNNSPLTVSGLADGGAHMRMICDASAPTLMLTHWVRDRSRGPRLPLAYAVHRMTQRNARLYGLNDRGLIAVGKRADINVIDHDRLELLKPYMAHDLPEGHSRLMQNARGYLATLVNGTATRLDDADTGARPGRLVRSRPGGLQ